MTIVNLSVCNIVVNLPNKNQILSFQKDVFVVSCDLVTDIALHHLADIHRSHDSTLSAFLAPVPQTSADREAANNPKAKKKTENTGNVSINSKTTHPPAYFIYTYFIYTPGI